MDEATINLILNTITFIQTKENVNLSASSVGCDSVADRYARELSKEKPNDYLSEF